jgi:hypothetical protein
MQFVINEFLQIYMNPIFIFETTRLQDFYISLCEVYIILN